MVTCQQVPSLVAQFEIIQPNWTLNSKKVAYHTFHELR